MPNVSPPPPAGCKMNDEFYPFRGEYKMDKRLNHGHSGTSRSAPPSVLTLSISGTDLVVEKMEAGSGTDLTCELIVGNGRPRRLPPALTAAALSVPSDGKQYQLAASLHSSAGKHYSKILLNGTGTKTLQLRVPDGCEQFVSVLVDGDFLKPVGGFYVIPVTARDCVLFPAVPKHVVTEPESARRRPSSCAPHRPSESRLSVVEKVSRPETSRGVLANSSRRQSVKTPLFAHAGEPVHGAQPGHDADAVPFEPQHVTLEAIPGFDDDAIVECVTTGRRFPLLPHLPAEVPTAGGNLKIYLPRPLQAAQQIHPNDFLDKELTTPPPLLHRLHDVRGPQTSSPMFPRMPLVETSVKIEGGEPVFEVVAEGFLIELSSEHTAATHGFGRCAIPVNPATGSTITFMLRDSDGVSYLRQSTRVPAREYPPLAMRVEDRQDGTTFYTTPDSAITADGVPVATTENGVPLPHAVAHVVNVSRRNEDGTMSCAMLEVAEKHVVDHSWMAQLAGALRGTDVDQTQRIVQAIQTPDADSTRILDFVKEQLARNPPVFEVEMKGSNVALTGVQCHGGYGLTAATGGAPACLLPSGGQVDLQPGTDMHIHAMCYGKNQPCASLVLHPTTIQNPSEVFVERLLDAVQRGNTDPHQVVEELMRLQVEGLTEQRLVTQLTSLLSRTVRRVSEKPPHNITITAGVVPDNTRLFASIDSSPPISILPRGPPVMVPNSCLGISITAQGVASSPGQSVTTLPPTSRLVKDLLLAYYANNGKPLSQRWAEVQATSGVPEEPDLLRHLVRIARDSEAAAVLAATAPSSTGSLSVADRCISFACGNGQLTGITCKVPLQLSYSVDGLPLLPLAQGAQIPELHPFAEGSTHQVRLVASDASGTAQSEVVMTVPGATKAPLVSALPGRSAEIPGFLDVSLSAVDGSTHMRIAAPPELTISCLVDGRGGDCGKCEHVAVMDAQRSHRVAIDLIGSNGRSVHQQKLDIPVLAEAAWTINLEKSSVHVHSSPGTLITSSIDRALERTMVGPIGFSCDKPHHILLRKYPDGAGRNAYSGELQMNIPSMLDAEEVSCIIRALAERHQLVHPHGGLIAGGPLQLAYDRTTSDTLRQLIDAIAALLASSGDNAARTPSSSSITQSTPGHQRGPLPVSVDESVLRQRSSSSIVYFRLRGEE